MDEELGAAPLATIVVRGGVGPVLLAHQRPVDDLREHRWVVVEGCEGRRCVAVREHAGEPGRVRGLGRARQVDEAPLIGFDASARCRTGC